MCPLHFSGIACNRESLEVRMNIVRTRALRTSRMIHENIPDVSGLGIYSHPFPQVYL